MSKWKVTFEFRHGPVMVEVVSDGELDAIARARCAELGPPVPEFIAATVVEVKHGGRRCGSGNRLGVALVAEPRVVCKTIRWTEKEWGFIELSAIEAGLSPADYQRMKLLG